jgi:hypothetical protein
MLACILGAAPTSQLTSLLTFNMCPFFSSVYIQLSGELQCGIELPDLEGVSGATQLAFLPDGATLAALCTDGGVRFVDVKEGKLVAEVRR